MGSGLDIETKGVPFNTGSGRGKFFQYRKRYIETEALLDLNALFWALKSPV
jgi:hypothetical protein